MKKTKLLELRQLINNDEDKAWKKIISLRREFERNFRQIFASLELLRDVRQAIEKANEVISASLEVMCDPVKIDEMEPGHAIGHLSRDYLHALILANHQQSLDPRIVYLGMVAGTLHDTLGSALVKRYAENQRVIRHAEASALMFLEISKIIGLDCREAMMIAYSIAAHTHYLKRHKVVCTDGVIRTTRPYPDTLQNGLPIYPVIFTRWCDRLDLIGPCYFGRHYLTLTNDHKDYNLNDFCQIKYHSHMRPLNRTSRQIKLDPNGPTFCEHLQSIIETQIFQSPYGRYDYGFVMWLREQLKASEKRILKGFERPTALSLREETKLLNNWNGWLATKVEPSTLGVKASEILHEKFLGLPQETKTVWYSAMSSTLEEYQIWSKQMRKFLDQVSFCRQLPLLGEATNVL